MPQRHFQYHMPKAELLTALLPSRLSQSPTTINPAIKGQNQVVTPLSFTLSPHPSPSPSYVGSTSQIFMCHDKFLFIHFQPLKTQKLVLAPGPHKNR